MKKIIFVASILCVGSFLTFANPSYDPEDSFYTYVESWQSRGIIDTVPALRPYPVVNIKSILEIVMQEGSQKDKEVAGKFYEEVTGRFWHPYNITDERLKVSSEKGADVSFGHMTEDNVGVEGAVSFFDDVLSFGYDLGLIARSGKRNFDNDFLPLFVNSSTDNTYDKAVLGPFYTNINGNTIINFGKSNLYIQAGINRSGYGSSIGNGLALNDSSFHKPSLNIVYFNDKFSYSQQFASLIPSDVTGEDFSNNKFYSFHAVDFSPIPQLTLSGYEVAVFGGRFDWFYMIPGSYMMSQAFSGYADDGVNLIMGLAAKVNPIKGLVLSGDIFVDDLNVNELVKFNFDTRMTFAAKLGASYFFEDFAVDNISFEWTMVSPYMYSHRRGKDNIYNYQDFSNFGFNVGTAYQPNSMAFNIKANCSPTKKLDIGFAENLIVHGNIAESWSDSEIANVVRLEYDERLSSDGGIYTTYDCMNVYDPTSFDFLRQQHLMVINQTSAKVDYVLFANKYGKLSLNFAYAFEYVHNKGVDSNIYSDLYTYDAVVKKQQWIDNLHDEFNNYFTIGFTYKF